MSLAELFMVPVEVASRTPHPATLAPSSVTVFTRAQIRSMGVRSVEELLNFVPGFYAPRDTFIGPHRAASARGRMTIPGSNDILFLMDGLRLNDYFTGGALQFNRRISIGNVRQVEIIRGPGSALYGANAFLGVVNIVTEKDLNELYVAGGNLQAWDGWAGLSSPLGDGSWSLFAAGFSDDGETFDALVDLNSPSAKDPQDGFDVHGVLEVGGLDLRMRHTDRSVEDAYLFNSVANGINEFTSRQSSIWSSYDIVEGERSAITATASYSEIEAEGQILVAPAALMQSLAQAGLTNGTEAFIGGPIYDESTWIAALDWQFRYAEGRRWLGGVTFMQEELKDFRGRGNYEFADFVNVLVFGQPGPIRFYDDQMDNFEPAGDLGKRDITGIYLQHEGQWTDGLRTTAGVRFDDYSDFGSTVNPRAALIYEASPATTFKVMYGEAFRAPNKAEQSIINSPVDLGNPDLEPEQVKTLELAWWQDFGSIRTGATFFSSRISDQTQRQPVAPDDPRNTFVNSGSLDLSGAELELFGSWRDDTLTFRGSLTRYFDKTESAPDVPKEMASFIVEQRFSRWNLNLNGYYRGGTRSNFAGGPDFGSYWVVNAAARLSVRPGVSLVGEMQNLLDKSYRNPSLDFFLVNGEQNRGRTFLLGVVFDL